MIPRISVALDGVDDVIRVLRALPPNVAGKLVKPAMQEAGNVLKSRARAKAYRVLQDAQRRGYKRKKGVHLYETAATRAKTYRKGDTTFVAVGFDYKAGGFHAHLVELGHRIVKGGSLGTGMKAGVTAAGKRYLRSMGWGQGDYEIPGSIVLRGKRKGKPRIQRGAWQSPSGNIGVAPEFVNRKRIRGGGVATGGMTAKKPMLGPAFDEMKRPMMIAIENELRKIGPEAERLAKNPHKPVDSIIGGKLL